MGLSGEGKSTLLGALRGFDRDYEGNIGLYGKEMRTLSPWVIFGTVGYYSQAVGVFNDTLWSNIPLGRKPDQSKMEHVVSEMGSAHLGDRLLGEAGSFVSGGERQRIQLARLLYADTPVAVVDEPLTNLDVIDEGLLIERLSAFLAGRSGILISHKPEALRLATHLLVLSDGKVAENGPFAEASSRSEVYQQIISAYLDSAQRIGHEFREQHKQPRRDVLRR